jgi:3-hydroxyisobutyrate dehydrogenase-like beta-hydroxyacid dehydrogenase
MHSPTSAPLRVGILGYGEAGQRFASDFVKAGAAVLAYSPSTAKADTHAPVRERAAHAGVELAASARAVCERADLVIALTPGGAALRVLRRIGPHLRSDQIYVDASTASVKDMEEADRMLEGSAAFVDAAIMDPVSLDGIGVHTVASGAQAERFRERVAPYGMNIQVVGERAGAASAMKLLRSVCMKGLAALLLESLEGAQRYGIADALVTDMARFIDGRPFEQVVKRFVCGTAVHAPRRVREMTQALALLRSLDASTRMTRSTREMLKAITDMGLRERFGGREPDAIAQVLDALIDVKGVRAPAACHAG